MEQQLIDILEKAKSSEDIDEVSQAMITARVVSALMKVRKLTAQYLESIEAIQKENDLELKLGGLVVVLNITSDILSDNQMYVLGSRSNVLKNIAQITEKTNG